MSFRKRRPSQIPEVNLVPMMDVLMTVLTFFIIISMTLRGQQVLNINLPGVGSAAAPSAPAAADVPTLVVGLTAKGDIVLGDRTVLPPDLALAIQTHLAEHPTGKVVLQADRTLSYREVAAMLKTMRDIGGDRVSLAIGSGTTPEP